MLKSMTSFINTLKSVIIAKLLWFQRSKTLLDGLLVQHQAEASYYFPRTPLPAMLYTSHR